MSTRRDAREWALQMLCWLDINPVEDLGAAFEEFEIVIPEIWQERLADMASTITELGRSVEIVAADDVEPGEPGEPGPVTAPDADTAAQMEFERKGRIEDLRKVVATVEKLQADWAANPERVFFDRDRIFMADLVRGVTQSDGKLDELIEAAGQNWRIGRMGSVERNVLRMATYEMMQMDDVPAPVVMNEAVDIAKYFSSDESGRFVNGLLDRIRRDLEADASQK
jgi:transcription antitermination factor NusB